MAVLIEFTLNWAFFFFGSGPEGPELEGFLVAELVTSEQVQDRA